MMEEQQSQQEEVFEDFDVQQEVEKRMIDQKLQAINQGAILLNTAIKVLGQRSLIFFSVLCILFLFSWVMAAPDVIRVVAATIASISIWFISKVDIKDIKNG
jgi:hypothetical protein